MRGCARGTGGNFRGSENRLLGAAAPSAACRLQPAWRGSRPDSQAKSALGLSAKPPLLRKTSANRQATKNADAFFQNGYPHTNLKNSMRGNAALLRLVKLNEEMRLCVARRRERTYVRDQAAASETHLSVSFTSPKKAWAMSNPRNLLRRESCRRRPWCCPQSPRVSCRKLRGAA